AATAAEAATRKTAAAKSGKPTACAPAGPGPAAAAGGARNGGQRRIHGNGGTIQFANEPPGGEIRLIPPVPLGWLGVDILEFSRPGLGEVERHRVRQQFFELSLQCSHVQLGKLGPSDVFLEALDVFERTATLSSLARHEV